MRTTLFCKVEYQTLLRVWFSNITTSQNVSQVLNYHQNKEDEQLEITDVCLWTIKQVQSDHYACIPSLFHTLKWQNSVKTLQYSKTRKNKPRNVHVPKDERLCESTVWKISPRQVGCSRPSASPPPATQTTAHARQRTPPRLRGTSLSGSGPRTPQRSSKSNHVRI